MCEVNGPVRMAGLRKSVNIMTSPKWRPKASMMILSLKPYWLLGLCSKNTAQAHRREICDFELWEFPHFYAETESAIKFNPNRSCLTLSRKTSTSSNTCVAEIMEAFLCTAHARAQHHCCIQIQPWMKRGFIWMGLEEASAQPQAKLAYSL